MADLMIGETTMTTAVAPVMTGSASLKNVALSNPAATASKSKIPTEKSDKSKNLRNRAVNGMLGIKEDRDGSIIPDGAEVIDDKTIDDAGLTSTTPELPANAPKAPATGKDNLISTLGALVAPDVTPTKLEIIDFTRIPGFSAGSSPRTAVDTVLARPAQPAQPEAPVAPAQPSPTTVQQPAPVTAESFVGLLNAGSSDGMGESLLRMPLQDHKVSDGKALMDVMKRFIR